jgi:Fe-S-cluster-containing dehydrogenase component
MDKIILFDAQLCAGCKRCEKICSFVHGGVFSKARSRTRNVKWESEGVYIPLSCFHCEEPPCLAVCPVGAISKDEKGAVQINNDRCMACRLCLQSCPFGMIDFNPVERIVMKCDFCKDLGYDPQCVAECPTKALELVPLDDRAGLTKRRKAAEKIRSQMEMVMGKTTMA